MAVIRSEYRTLAIVVGLGFNFAVVFLLHNTFIVSLLSPYTCNLAGLPPYVPLELESIKFKAPTL